MNGSLDSFVTPFRKVLVALSLFVFPQQTGPLTRGGWVEVMRSTSTGEAQSLGSRNVPAVWPGTALTPSTTATATQTMSYGKGCQSSNIGELLTVLLPEKKKKHKFDVELSNIFLILYVWINLWSYFGIEKSITFKSWVLESSTTTSKELHFIMDLLFKRISVGKVVMKVTSSQSSYGPSK